MIITGLVEMGLVDPRGNYIEEPRIEPMHTFVGNFIRCLFAMMQQSSTNANIVNTAGTPGVSWDADLLRLDAAATDANYGLVVGTGTSSTTVSTYALGAKISHGTGAGQLYYQVTSSEVPIISPTEAKFKIKRVFDNGSSDSTRTIREVGLYSKPSGSRVCIVRDLLGTPFDIPLGSSGMVSYFLKIVY